AYNSATAATYHIYRRRQTIHLNRRNLVQNTTVLSRQWGKTGPILLILMTLMRATVNNTRGIHLMMNPLTLAKKTSYSEPSSKRWPNIIIASTRAIIHGILLFIVCFIPPRSLGFAGCWIGIDMVVD